MTDANTNKKTAAEAYADHMLDVAVMLDWFELALDAHNKAAEAEPNNWNFVGDLGEVRRLLKQTLAFLSASEEAQIEKSLQELRK